MGTTLVMILFVVLAYETESIVDSSLRCEEYGRDLIWDCQYDS